MRFWYIKRLAFYFGGNDVLIVGCPLSKKKKIYTFQKILISLYIIQLDLLSRAWNSRRHKEESKLAYTRFKTLAL